MLFRYHWGSVVGGSLLLGFFYFIDLVVNIFNVIFLLLSLKILKPMEKVKIESLSDLTGIVNKNKIGKQILLVFSI